jgi:hypothetical protein
MARDSKQVFRFLQVAQNNGNNQLNIMNYNNSASIQTTGAAIGFNAVGSANMWSVGASTTINRGGFRTTIADQTNIISGETSATPNDPALFGNLNGSERYCHVTLAPYGAHLATVRFEITVEGASDTGVGTAGTDWSPIGSSIPIPVASAVTKALVISSGVGTLATHGLNVGDILIPQTAGTGFAIHQPLYVVSLPTPNPTGTVGLSKTPGSGIIDTSLSGSVTFTLCNTRRVLAIPLSANPKPWVRVAVRVLAQGATPAAHVGVVIDNAFLTMGRDTASLF